MRIFIIAALAVSAFMLTEAANEDFSDSFCRFLYIWNGNFVSEGNGRNANNAYVSLEPIKIPGNQAPARLYSESSKTMNREFALTAAEEADGTIRTQVYKLSEGGYQNLEHIPNCGATFKETSTGVFEGDWTDCTQEIKGKNPVYHFSASCASAVYDMTISGGKHTSQFSRIDRYPEIPSVRNQYRKCDDPCGA